MTGRGVAATMRSTVPPVCRTGPAGSPAQLLKRQSPWSMTTVPSCVAVVKTASPSPVFQIDTVSASPGQHR